ncbi:hypothetical protein AcW2_007686 [Taiwanofungus camphoratus]|nr:hypothetical protein AcW2_007686 [Antrodia cinnamomea]
MKRNSGLVSYESSDEDNVSSPHPRSKKRKLPVLSPSLVPPPPLDDPTLHQGRMRTTPHVEGQFAAFIYVPLVLDHHSLLYKLLLKVFALAKSIVPCLHPIVALDSSNPDMACKNNESTGGDDSAKNQVHGELHVSLTRPIYLRAHQREALRRAVNTVARSQSAFSSSFATFTELTNDERTRTFLALEVGAGHHQLKALSDALTPTLRSIRQDEFYAEPRFHASFAWALLDRFPSDHRQDAADHDVAPPLSTSMLPITNEQSFQEGAASSSQKYAGERSDIHSPKFPTIASFPPSLVQKINKEFNSALVSRKVGMFDVRELCVKIGKDVSKWNLVG